MKWFDVEIAFSKVLLKLDVLTLTRNRLRRFFKFYQWHVKNNKLPFMFVE